MAFDTTKLPLPTNAAQEAGGILTSISASDALIMSLLTQILASLEAIRLQNAAAFGAELSPSLLNNFDNIQ